MNHHVPLVPFPSVSIAEWVGFNRGSAIGLFLYRHLQARNILEFPDYGGGDLTLEQRREGLREAVYFQKPLTALSIFLGVVALEDFIRDFGGRLANESRIVVAFPGLVDLKAKVVQRAPQKAFKQLDRDPISFIDPEEINQAFFAAIGVAPIPIIEYQKLRDLAVIRHTVAHHGSVIRPIDVARFQYFIVHPNQTLNPPRDFVEETLKYLWTIGRALEVCVRDAIFAKLLPTFSNDWQQNPPNELIELIEFFDYFGFIESTNVTVGYSELGSELRLQQEVEQKRIKGVLIERCLNDLQHNYSQSV